MFVRATSKKRSRHGAPTACTHLVSGSISLPSPGFFSPFPHGTGSLSVSWEYLALEDGPPIFNQDNTCPDLLDFISKAISRTGLSPSIAGLSRPFRYDLRDLRAGPLSLAATQGVSIDFLSYGYLDVSVPRVRLTHLCIQCVMTTLTGGRVSPFGYFRIKACLPAPRNFSQATTSFIASSCLGIHQVRFVT